MENEKSIRNFVVCALILATTIANAGTFTTAPWTSDADSGISAGKLYTHTGKFMAPVDGAPFYAGNGVWFEGDRDLSGVDWQLSNIPSTYTGGSSNVQGSGANLLVSFVYGDDDLNDINHPVLRLNNLIPGQKYILTCYAKGWEDSGRHVNIIPSDDPNAATVINQDMYGANNGLLLKYTYLAPASGSFSLTFDQVAATNVSWHHYAFSNELVTPVYVDPRPAPGTFTGLTVTLDFTAIPDEGTDTSNVVYNLYWGSDPNTTNEVAGLTEGTFTLEGLLESTTYHWKVDVYDGQELLYATDPNNSGKTWTFTTKTLAPATKALEYQMDENAGTLVPEVIGGYDAAALNFDDPNEGGTAWVEGIQGNCLSFDGLDSYVDMGNAAPLPFGAGEGFSISGYFRTIDREGPLVAFRHSADDDPIVAVTVGFDGADSLPGQLRSITRHGGQLFRITGPRVDDGGWNHFALTRDTDGTMTLYLNGVACGSLNDQRGGYNVDWRGIGAEIRWIHDNRASVGQRYLEGLIDEVVVWNGALKQTQIDAMVDLIPYRLNPTPINDAKVDLDVVLSWNAPIDRIAADSYNVYVSTDIDMSNSLDGATGLTTPQFVPTEPLEYDTRYFWQVEVVSEGAIVYTSPIWTFKTIAETVGRFSTHPWTGDADSGISTAKTYTHTGKFNSGGTDGDGFYAGNGVYFEGDMNRAGTNWTLTGADNVYDNPTDYAVNISGDSANLARRFFYGDTDVDHPVLTLTGLVPGTKYVTTFYAVGFSGPWVPEDEANQPGRRVDIEVSDNPGSPTRIEQNAAGAGNGLLIKYTFTAQTTEISFTFDAAIAAHSWHHYAFSNEIALPFDLTPSPVVGQTTDLDVTLSWKPSPAAAAYGATYNLTVATDPELTTVVLQRDGLTDTSLAITGLDPQTAYYWRVNGLLEGNVVYNGPVWTFYTRSTTPAQVIAGWKLDEGSGTLVSDIGQTGLYGTLVNFADPNAAWVPGIEGTALRLDGVDDYVSVVDTPVTIPQGYAFSVSGFFRTRDSQGPLFTMRHPGILSVYVGFDGADNVPGHFRFISSSDGLRRITGPRVDDGLWHHFAVTRSTFGKVELYIDGVSVGQTVDLAGEYTNDWNAFGTDRQWVNDWLSQTSHPHDWYFLDGLIDEITVWQDELQPDQIAALAAMLPVAGDLNGDGLVGVADLGILADGWLTNDPAADINVSGNVDLVDFAILSEDWKD